MILIDQMVETCTINSPFNKDVHQGTTMPEESMIEAR